MRRRENRTRVEQNSLRQQWRSGPLIGRQPEDDNHVHMCVPDGNAYFVDRQVTQFTANVSDV